MNEKKMRTELGAQIAAARKAAGLTQSQAAEIIGCTKNSVSQLELGHDGGLPLIIAMMQVYQVSFGNSLFVRLPDADADSPRIIERKKKS